MRHEIHLAALRAAAKVAFATGVLVGCASSVEEPSDTESSNLETASGSVADASTGSSADASGPTTDAGVPPVLPDPSCCWFDFPGECDWSAPGCTPWGPPVPPAMRAAA